MLVVQPSCSVLLRINGEAKLATSGEVFDESLIDARNKDDLVRQGYLKKVTDAQAVRAGNAVKQNPMSADIPGVEADLNVLAMAADKNLGQVTLENKAVRISTSTPDKDPDETPVLSKPSARKAKAADTLEDLNAQVLKKHPQMKPFDTVEEAKTFLESEDA